MSSTSAVLLAPLDSAAAELLPPGVLSPTPPPPPGVNGVKGVKSCMGDMLILMLPPSELAVMGGELEQEDCGCWLWPDKDGDATGGT